MKQKVPSDPKRSMVTTKWPTGRPVSNVRTNSGSETTKKNADVIRKYRIAELVAIAKELNHDRAV